MTTFNEQVALLEQYADKYDCDGLCDELPPHRPCPECLARHALNEIGEIVRDAVREIEAYLLEKTRETASDFLTIEELIEDYEQHEGEDQQLAQLGLTHYAEILEQEDSNE